MIVNHNHIVNVADETVVIESLFIPDTKAAAVVGKHQLVIRNCGQVTVKRCIFAYASHCGLWLDTLEGAVVEDNVFLDCGVALQLIAGGCIFRNNLIYGGHFVEDKGKLTHNTALRLYWPLKGCDNNLIMPAPNQAQPKDQIMRDMTAAVKCMVIYPDTIGDKFKPVVPTGAIVAGGEYTEGPWTPPSGDPVEYLPQGKNVGGSNLVAAGWPGKPFVGKTRGLNWAMTMHARTLHYQEQLDKVVAGGSVVDAINALRKQMSLPRLAEYDLQNEDSRRNRR